MVITSRNKTPIYYRYGIHQFRYAMIYVVITLVVLGFLNIYCSSTSQKLFYRSKESAMIEKCNLAANEVAGLEILNSSTAASAAGQLGSLKVTRMMITDALGVVVYDSQGNGVGGSRYALFPEIVKAMAGNDVFTGQYQSGALRSRAAVPVYSGGTLMGTIYLMDVDSEQGLLIRTLQKNMLSITVMLEVIVLAFTVFYSGLFSRRLQRIMSSMRIIQDGDYSHKVNVGGRDELTFLGDEFNDLTERLQDSERKRRQFVSDASHELKTPLASIKLLSDSILQNDMDMDTVREFVSDIGNEADRLNKMTEKLLSLTRMENQTDEQQEFEIVNIIPTARQVIRMLSAIAGTHGVTITTDFQDDCPILILEDDLYQILFNLVENGIKYNTSGGTLTVRLRRVRDNAVLQVTDTGVGIPPEALSHVFERFYRVDKARSRQAGGSGLGLAIVRNMVERNHGTITVESTVGVGSTFTVTFPIFDTEEETQ